MAGVELQLSRNQAIVMVVAYEAARHCARRRELYDHLFSTDGPASASQRASLSRTLKRLVEQGLIEKHTKLVRLTPWATGLMEWSVANHFPILPNVNRAAFSAPRLTFANDVTPVAA